MALRCIFSSVILSFLYNGDQITLAYSRWGLTILLKRLRNISRFRYVNVLYIIPSFLLAMDIFLAISYADFNFTE